MSRGDNKQQNATVPAFYGSCVPFDSANPDNCSGTEYSVPFEVEGLEFEIIDLALAKDATCALTANGGMLCWGSNYRGMLGIETIEQISWPMSMPGLESGVVKIAGGKHRFCALINTGSVLCWGWNHKSRFADTDEAIIHTPTLVQGLDGSALSIAIGDSHTCTIMRDGKVKCWGANDSAQLGNLSMAESLIPLDVPALGGPATKITAGQNHTCAIMDNGKVKCWGSNKCGQIDIKIVNSSPVPLDVISPN